MKVKKRVLAHLTKCYCVAPLIYKGEKHYLAASEKDFPCLLFDGQGNQAATVWEHPGGTMSAVQIPGADGAFLATHRFYSPNDSREACIVMAVPGEDGWKITRLALLPHVHRFDILERDGVRYLIACTLCSGRDYKDDWSHPGKIYGCRLPGDLEHKDGTYRLPLVPIKEQLLKNHGYSRWRRNKVECGLITSEEGVFCVTPPEPGREEWGIERLLDVPVSDCVPVDFDGDGLDELLTLSPFHGDTVRIYHLDGGGAYRQVYEHPDKLPFAHGICGGFYRETGQALVGCRQGGRELLRFYWNPRTGGYESQVLDRDAGSANVLWDGDVILSANRERDEVAWYEICEERYGENV